MTTSGLHPLKRKIQAQVPALATDVDGTVLAIGKAPIAGIVSAVTYTPVANITGVATNNRKVALVNKGQDGNGAVEVAALTYGNGTNSTDYNESSLTLSATAADLVVVAGDILAWASTAPGTGLADPGGLVEVTISRD